MNQSAVLIHTNMCLIAEVSDVALFYLMGIRIPLPSLHSYYRNFIITANISAPVCPISTFSLVFL